MPLSISCPECTNEIPQPAERCPHCGRPGVFEVNRLASRDREPYAIYYEELKHDSDSALALGLASISLNAELPDDIRLQALSGLDDLSTDPLVVERLENVLYARPLPADADLEGALGLRHAELTPESDFLARLKERQSLISRVCDAWDCIPGKVFGEQKTEFQQVAVREGLFRTLVLKIEGAESIDAFLINALLNPALHAMRNYRQVLQDWTKCFRTEIHPPKIREEMDELNLPGSFSSKPRKRRRSIDRAAVLQNVESQKAMIVGAMRNAELVRVRKFVGELVDYQLKNGEPVHAAKSLCDLATAAKGLGIYSLQLELAEQSTRVKGDDAWSWVQYADALLGVGRSAEALTAYDRADGFGGGAVVWRGRAETLKALGRLDEALAAYDAIIADSPEDLVSRSGRADTLKTLGRLNEALAAYNAIIDYYPENLVCRNGRAETLKALGRLNEALAAYDAVIADYPESVVSRSGRANTLRALGRLGDALTEYDLVIGDFREDVVSLNGRADILKALGRFSEALDAYDAIIADYPEDVVSRSGRANTLRALGRLNDALDAYDRVIADYPNDVVARSGRADTLKALGRLNEALAAYDAIIADYPKDVVCRNGRANTLKALGRLNEALAAYEAIIADHPANVVSRNGRADTLKALGRLNEALAAYDAIIADYPENVVSRRGRSSVLAILELYDEALAELPSNMPETRSDWIGFHLRGMIMLRTGNTEEAIRIFQHGVERNPIAGGRQYFQTPLSVALMRRGNFAAARSVLSKVEARELQPQVNLLLVHCFGEGGQTAKATEAFANITTKPWSISAELIEELHRRYVLKQPSQRSDDWVFNEETASILVMANQQAPLLDYPS